MSAKRSLFNPQLSHDYTRLDCMHTSHLIYVLSVLCLGVCIPVGLVFVVCVMCLTGMLVRHYKQNYSSEARERQTINYSERTPILTATAAKTDTTPEL